MFPFGPDKTCTLCGRAVLSNGDCAVCDKTPPMGTPISQWMKDVKLEESAEPPWYGPKCTGPGEHRKLCAPRGFCVILYTGCARP